MKFGTGVLYLLARSEVSYAMLTNGFKRGADSQDLLPAEMVPSVQHGDTRDRVLADIDDRGFVFALDERDAWFFNTGEAKIPREFSRIQIVLSEGVIRVQKSFLRRQGMSILTRILELMQWDFYLEAAALLRLRRVGSVPRIWSIDTRIGIIEMDYVWGRDLRQMFLDGTAQLDKEISRQVANLLVSVVKSGVIPRDVHAANFIQARRSRKLYMVDFNSVYLTPVPGWRSHLGNMAFDVSEVWQHYVKATQLR